jgi:murein L,D-transpeptidase YcbB/YkuD
MNARPRLTPRILAAAFVFAALLCADGCHRHRKTISAPNTTDYADNIQAVTASKTLSILRWPNYSDYQPAVATFYDDRNNEVAWTRDGKPTKQALAFIQAFNDAAAKGLNPEDYDASRWPARIQKLAGKNEDDFAQFDVAMTIAVMRYISDLHIGRVNPTHFDFDINVDSKKYDLAEFVSDNAVDADDVPKLIAGVEPNSEQYRKTEAALAHYLDLANQQAKANTPSLKDVTKPIDVGQAYSEAGALLARLKLEGDAPADEAATSYDQALSDAVKSYQHRHGITEDGKLTEQTVKSLNVPLSARVVQLQDSLERWRWLPDQYLNARIIVNLPEFVLHAYDENHQPEFTMKVVVGKVVGEHQTPVFAHMMKYLIFRPYWNVPTDIARKELVPHMAANKGYLAAKNFEVTNTKGDILTDYTANQVAHGGVMVREKPGPKNSLGLVKFMFPNQYDVYLHSTPATELFNRTRRDFSHGCVRVQEPAKLAAWVLSGQKDADKGSDGGDWDLDKVTAAMQSGADNHQVNLKTPIPIVIFYVTGFVEDDGHTHFFDDIYGYDAQLQAVLAKGMPYPTKPEPVIVKTTPGDTQ